MLPLLHCIAMDLIELAGYRWYLLLRLPYTGSFLHCSVYICFIVAMYGTMDNVAMGQLLLYEDHGGPLGTPLQGGAQGKIP